MLGFATLRREFLAWPKLNTSVWGPHLVLVADISFVSFRKNKYDGQADDYSEVVERG